jgi:hypothetical protein
VLDWGQKAKDLTDGRGVDHVIEVGGPGTLRQSITACRTGGHIALIGVLTGFAGEVAIPALFSNQIRISGISIRSRADQEDMIRAITANRLKPVIDRSFRLQEIVAAFKYYESPQHFGKVASSFKPAPEAWEHRSERPSPILPAVTLRCFAASAGPRRHSTRQLAVNLLRRPAWAEGFGRGKYFSQRIL